MEVVDFFISLMLILVVPSVCVLFSHLKHALLWLPIGGALANSAFIYGAVYFSEQPGWAFVAGFFALLWGYALCFTFTLVAWLLRRYRTKTTIPNDN